MFGNMITRLLIPIRLDMCYIIIFIGGLSCLVKSVDFS